jgi:hypothetical protein
MINNNIDLAPTNKVPCGACKNNDDVRFAICKTSFCSFNDHLCKGCFELCDHNCSNTDFSNVLITKHETKECNICLEEKNLHIECKSVIFINVMIVLCYINI